MHTKTIVLLAGGALLLGGIAWMLAERSAKPAKPADTASIKLFPETSARIGESARLVIAKGTEKVEVVRDTTSNTWGLASSDNYPAVEDNVRRIVRGVLDAEVVERKTAAPELYEMIGVNDPVGENAGSAKGHLVSIFDAQGKPLAEVIIGNRFEAANWDQTKAATFVRPAGQAQSYLVRGTFNLATKPTDWLKRDVLSLDTSRFWKARIEQPAAADGTPGSAIHIEKPDRAQEQYVLAELPEGKELTDPSSHQRVLHTLGTWTLDDVRKADGFDMSGAVTGTFTTYEGMVYTTRCVQREGKHWATVQCAFDPAAAAPRPPDQPLPENHEESMRKEAAEINARLAPWVFQIANHKGNELTATVESLTKPLQPPPTPDLPPGMMIPPG